MITYDDAITIAENEGRKCSMGKETIDLSDALGRVCAEKIVSPMVIQPFDNSAMDGFAVRLADLEAASNDNLITLHKSAVIAAGDAMPSYQLEQGTCIHIMTGAPVPAGVEAVVPIELVSVEGDQITFQAQPKKHANIRFAGEDFKKGEMLLNVGDQLEAKHILPLATLGVDKIAVFKKPKVAFMATGRELVDDLSAPLESGQIYNSNRSYALAMLKSLGCDAQYYGTIRDDAADFEKKVALIMEDNADIAVSSGAVSAGEFDFVKEGLQKAGAEIIFHKVKLKPGKPNLLARLPNGTLYFGLPGNPVASAVGLRFFVVPALRAMLKQGKERPFYARSTNKFSKRAGLHMILKGRTESKDNGSLAVDILDGQASFMVSPFLNMNCWIHASEDLEEIGCDDCVNIYPLIPAS